MQAVDQLPLGSDAQGWTGLPHTSRGLELNNLSISFLPDKKGTTLPASRACYED